MSKVNYILEQTLSILQSLHFEEIVCVLNQALFAKAADIVLYAREDQEQNDPDRDPPHNMQPAVYHRQEIPGGGTSWSLCGGRHSNRRLCGGGVMEG